MAGQLGDGLYARIDTEKAHYITGEDIAGTVVIVATS
ncbi:hypothetical protein PSACC_00294, partial [Paramicrosporidium saccamoebae]